MINTWQLPWKNVVAKRIRDMRGGRPEIFSSRMCEKNATLFFCDVGGTISAALTALVGPFHLACDICLILPEFQQLHGMSTTAVFGPVYLVEAILKIR